MEAHNGTINITNVISFLACKQYRYNETHFGNTREDLHGGCMGMKMLNPPQMTKMSFCLLAKALTKSAEQWHVYYDTMRGIVCSKRQQKNAATRRHSDRH